MPTVIGIRFKDSGKTYFFDPNGHTTLDQGDHVIVETVRGPELAKVAYTPREAMPDEIVGELKPVLRRAEPADFERMRLLNARHDEVLARCGEKIREHGLPMRLVKAEYSFDGSRLTFYFTAEKRVDFRMLVRDLARAFRTRIELRQIGPRDEAKLLGGIGPCGRLLCCATFLPDYARVSIKMAKDQDLPLNPTKISGVCGRLLCCLSYEHDQYVQVKAALPRRGAWVQTPDGPGEVVSVNVLKETVIVSLAGSGVHEEFALGRWRARAPRRASRPRRAPMCCAPSKRSGRASSARSAASPGRRNRAASGGCCAKRSTTRKCSKRSPCSKRAWTTMTRHHASSAPSRHRTPPPASRSRAGRNRPTPLVAWRTQRVRAMRASYPSCNCRPATSSTMVSHLLARHHTANTHAAAAAGGERMWEG
jgi:cell fate regulator YaaT (PSP1 superfamily)